MQIPKDQILELLRSRGDQDQAGQAESELPDQVDTEQHSGLLAKFGIDPAQLLGGLGGGGGGGGGGGNLGGGAREPGGGRGGGACPAHPLHPVGRDRGKAAR